MNLILTHEQTDFDALASLFGASLLDERHIPVLPRRLNRNVRSFVTLYGAEFHFVDPRDVPQEKVERVMLVDTQSLITIKGMGEKTRVRVLDHHPLRPDLPNDWQVTIDEVGATTTLLIEALREHDGHLSPIHATLLLLGIYEDTGSLTYSRTTPRDVRAAAWLLEQGASLEMALDFLNPPLSPQQKKVYDQLTNNAETHHIHGHRVVIACGDASEMDEEVSSLAHKLRDLLDPDALFVLVETVDGVRLVARSTTDEIDVSEIASQFGGGGHDRAAAALVKSSDERSRPEVLEDACATLLELLPRFVQPSTTVAQIMSRGPQVLDPETPVKEVSKLMQRTGFEGFPVVRDGKVTGLLKRRAVDRALSHKLNLTAANLMDAGEVTVRPDDSLQTLQARMTDSGWGQIPVVDDDGKVIGIVTRTDLLKTLAPPPHPGNGNLSSKLEEALPAARLELIHRVADEASSRRMAVYIVGGFVRDLLLDRPSVDFDVVVEGDAIALAKALSKKYGGRVTSHTRFGTAKWFLQNEKIIEQTSSDSAGSIPEFLDLISARTEFYDSPSALPTVERGSIKLDLHRRDFTINTLALRLDGRHYGELHDYWGGLTDLERGVVRVLHSLSFVDDPTRMLRAVRYEQRYDFKIEARTLQLMGAARSSLERLSPERVRHELDLILDEPHAVAMLERLANLKLLTAIHPALVFHARRLDALGQPLPDEFGSLPTPGLLTFRRTLGWLLWLTPLKVANVESISRRLRFPSALVKLLKAASRLYNDLPRQKGMKPSEWVETLEDVPLLSIYAVYRSVAEEEIKQSLHDFLAEWRHIQPNTTGHELKRIGLPPGPRYQDILRKLRAAWLDGEIENEKEELSFLERLLSKGTS